MKEINKNIKKLTSLTILFFISLAHLSGSEENVEEQILSIRNEFKKINTASMKTLYFNKKESEENWHKGPSDQPDYLNAVIYLDKKGNIRKYVESMECTTFFQKEEYFWDNGQLFFIFHQDVMCGSGVGGEIRLYFWQQKQIRRLVKQTGFHDQISWSPPDIKYHKDVQEIIKEFKLK